MSSLLNDRKAKNKVINKMRRETEFTEHFECDNISKKFDELISLQQTNTKEPAYLYLAGFRNFMIEAFNFTDDLMLDRIFRAFDTDNDNKIKREEWFQGMSTILRGSLDKKCEFAFRVYDINNDGFLTRDDIHQFMKKTFAKQYLSDEEFEESIRELDDLYIKLLKNSESGDGNRFTLEDFKEQVFADDLLLEALGQFIPSRKASLMFEEYVVHEGHQDVFEKIQKAQKC